MNVRTAWFCPACQKHHAPHCDTCPSISEGTEAGRPDGVLPFVGSWRQKPPVIYHDAGKPYTPPFYTTCISSLEGRCDLSALPH